jgi:hypothetical protein
MTLCYYLTGAVMLKSFIVPLSEAPFNLIQGSIGALIFSPLGIALKKSGVTKKI